MLQPFLPIETTIKTLAHQFLHSFCLLPHPGVSLCAPPNLPSHPAPCGLSRHCTACSLLLESEHNNVFLVATPNLLASLYLKNKAYNFKQLGSIPFHHPAGQPGLAPRAARFWEQQEDKPQCTSAFQCSAHIPFATVSLTKARHKATPGSCGGEAWKASIHAACHLPGPISRDRDWIFMGALSRRLEIWEDGMFVP